MRLGVIDVGSNTVRLLVVDAHRGARPLPATSHKAVLRLAEHRDLLPGDPPTREALREAGRQVRAAIADRLRPLTRASSRDLAVGTSTTFRSPARVGGAGPRSDGMYAARALTRAGLAEMVPRIAALTAAARARLQGVSASRAPQLLAGAVVAKAAMDLLGPERLEICPWALREGIPLRRLDSLHR